LFVVYVWMYFVSYVVDNLLGPWLLQWHPSTELFIGLVTFLEMVFLEIPHNSLYCNCPMMIVFFLLVMDPDDGLNIISWVLNFDKLTALFELRHARWHGRISFEIRRSMGAFLVTSNFCCIQKSKLPIFSIMELPFRDMFFLGSGLTIIVTVLLMMLCFMHKHAPSEVQNIKRFVQMLTESTKQRPCPAHDT